MSLTDFIIESNKIEGITIIPDSDLLAAYNTILRLEEITIGDLSAFVYKVQRGAVLRSRREMDVRVGIDIPPAGGPEIIETLIKLLFDVNMNHIAPYNAHIKYEKLHPFMDGNGRSGRVLWLWHHLKIETFKEIPPSFLHLFYYETLGNIKT